MNKCKPKECCCNCIFQCTINLHPGNKEPFKGAINTYIAYGCASSYVAHRIHREEGIQHKDDLGSVIISDRRHGMCEMYQARDQETK